MVVTSAVEADGPSNVGMITWLEPKLMTIGVRDVNKVGSAAPEAKGTNAPAIMGPVTLGFGGFNLTLYSWYTLGQVSPATELVTNNTRH